MIPTIILDENVNSLKLRKRLKYLGFETDFLGNGVLDMDIKRYMERNINTVLITGDIELDLYFPNNRSFLVEHYQKPQVLAILIQHYMWQFTQ